MNHTMVDLEDTHAQVGDEVVVISDNPDDFNSFNQIAERHDLFVYSLLSSLASDIKRVLV
jgi:alanine racemase